MNLPAPLHALLADRTALLGGTAAALAGLYPAIIACYVLGGLVLPVLLIICAAHRATPTQRIALVRAYLLAPSPRTGSRPDTTSKGARVSRVTHRPRPRSSPAHSARPALDTSRG